MELNFPPIHKAVKVSNDDLASPKNFITIKNGVAVLLGNQFVFCFDIRGYFLGSQLIKEEETGEFEELMVFLEGKRLTPKFWESLVGKQHLRVLNEDCINISSEKINHDLYYEEPENYNLDLFNSFMAMFKKNWFMPNTMSFSFSPRPDVLKTFLDGFSNLIKKSQLVFKHKADHAYHIFAVDNMPYIFGMISSDSTITQKSFQFDTLESFIKLI